MGSGWNLRFQRKRRKQDAVLVSREGEHYDLLRQRYCVWDTPHGVSSRSVD
jgi:hypothetical protein